MHYVQNDCIKLLLLLCADSTHAIQLQCEMKVCLADTIFAIPTLIELLEEKGKLLREKDEQLIEKDEQLKQKELEIVQLKKSSNFGLTFNLIVSTHLVVVAYN